MENYVKCKGLTPLRIFLLLSLLALAVLADGTASADSKDFSKINVGQKEINIFPNRDVPYEIPVGESPRRQAEYLFQILRDNEYADLEQQLRRYVPQPLKILRTDKGNVEALDDIVALAVTATDPEVKEAFNLMTRAGTRGGGSLFNTRLEVLYWLAERNEFDTNDTLALAIALVTTLSLELGDNSVRKLVYRYANENLNLGREIEKWQRSEGLGYSLSDSSLLGKICWAWNGNESTVFGTHRLVDYISNGRKMDSAAYEYNFSTPVEMRRMRKWMARNELIRPTAGDTAEALEEYLWFDPGGDLTFPHWDYVASGPKAHNQNAGFHLRNLQKSGRSSGGCNAEYSIVDLGLRSVGIPSSAIFRNVYDDKRFLMGHVHSIFFDSDTNSWKAYPNQLERGDGARPMDEEVRLFIMKPPVFDGRSYFREKHDRLDTVSSGHHYIFPSITRADVAGMFKIGVPDSEFKQWLLH